MAVKSLMRNELQARAQFRVQPAATTLSDRLTSPGQGFLHRLFHSSGRTPRARIPLPTAGGDPRRQEVQP